MYRSHTKDLKIWGCKGVYPRLVRMDEFFTQSGCGFMRRYLHDHIFYFFIFLFFLGGGGGYYRNKPCFPKAEATNIFGRSRQN